MIRINDRFSISRDAHGWQLHETYIGKDGKTDAPKPMTRTTYPGQLWVCLARIVDACGESAADVAELRDTIVQTVGEFKEATKSLIQVEHVSQEDEGYQP